MKFKIHRGTQEIGGSCIEVWTDTSKVILDFGMPLVKPNKTPFQESDILMKSVPELIEIGVLPDLPFLYENKKENNGLVISHAHQDHFGLINFIENDFPVYLGKATHKLIAITNIFLPFKEWKISNPNYFKSGKPFYIGDIEITPYLMDHSAYDAYAFLVKADGKSLFYSGDFRLHGRKRLAFEWFTHQVKEPVDYLLLEGTCLGREEQVFQTEDEIEAVLKEYFKTTFGINFIYCSGQNIDRIVSIYKACRETGKTLVIDFYIAHILTALAKLGAKIPHPSWRFPGIRVFYPTRLTGMMISRGRSYILDPFEKYQISIEEIDEKYKDVVMIVRPTMFDDLAQLKNIQAGNSIYSMWSGYRSNPDTKVLMDFFAFKGLNERVAHTSGHADINGLKRMIEAVWPKHIVPIHTFNGNEYAKLFYNWKVVDVKDLEEVSV